MPDKNDTFKAASERLMRHQSINFDIEKWIGDFERWASGKRAERHSRKEHPDYMMGARDSFILFTTMLKRMDAFAQSAPSFISDPREQWYVEWSLQTLLELRSEMCMPPEDKNG